MTNQFWGSILDWHSSCNTPLYSIFEAECQPKHSPLDPLYPFMTHQTGMKSHVESLDDSRNR